MTASRVVDGSDLVAAETRVAVLRAIAETGHEPDLVARSMRTKVTRPAGFVRRDLASIPNATAAQALEPRLAEAGCG